VYGLLTYNTIQIDTQCWLKENLNIGTLTMYDLYDQLILSKQVINETTGIDVSGLKPGVYFVRFSDDRMTGAMKFVKN